MVSGLILDGDVRLLEESSRCVKELHADPALADELAQVRAEALSHYQMKIALN